MGKFIGTESQKSDARLMLSAWARTLEHNDVEGQKIFSDIIKEQWGFDMDDEYDFDMFLEMVKELDQK